MADYSNHHRQIGKLGGMSRDLTGEGEARRKAAAEAGRMRRFYAQVPDHVTDPVERARLADRAMRLHMSRMALKSAQKRAKPKKAKDEAA